MVAKQRTALWDNLRFLLMLTVVIGHLSDRISSSSPLSQSLYFFICAFHIPLFFFVSGLFHKNTRIGEKILSYLSIYIVLKIALFAVHRLVGNAPSFSLLTTDAIPWFMFALAVYVGLGWLLRNVNLKFVLCIWVLMACFVGYDQSIGDFLMLSRIIIFFPFYLLGMLTSRPKLEAVLLQPKLKLLGVAVLVVWTLICLFWLDEVYFLRHLFTGRNPFRDSIRPYGSFFRLFCYGLTCVTGFACMLVVPARSLGPVTLFGQRTLQVYFWHNLIHIVLADLGLHKLCLSWGRPGVLVWSLGIPLLLTVVLSLRPFRHPTDWLLNLSAKKEE